MLKKIITLSVLAFSVNGYCETSPIECRISGLNILNDQVISGESIVTVSNVKGQASIAIEAVSSKGESLNKSQYVDNIDLQSATSIKLPSFQYFHLALVKTGNTYSLKMTDDQTGDSHLADIKCK